MVLGAKNSVTFLAFCSSAAFFLFLFLFLVLIFYKIFVFIVLFLVSICFLHFFMLSSSFLVPAWLCEKSCAAASRSSAVSASDVVTRTFSEQEIFFPDHAASVLLGMECFLRKGVVREAREGF